ncbi:MAG: cell division protein SepF [Halobacteria archaeon]
MSLVDKLLGQETGPRSPNEYEELDLRQYEDDIDDRNVDTKVHIAELRGQDGIMEVKDKVYDGDLVIADVSHFKSSQSRLENLIENFREITEEAGGDIVQKGEDQIIIAPSGVRISREKISS